VQTLQFSQAAALSRVIRIARYRYDVYYYSFLCQIIIPA